MIGFPVIFFGIGAAVFLLVFNKNNANAAGPKLQALKARLAERTHANGAGQIARWVVAVVMFLLAADAPPPVSYIFLGIGGFLVYINVVRMSNSTAQGASAVPPPPPPPPPLAPPGAKWAYGADFQYPRSSGNGFFVAMLLGVFVALGAGGFFMLATVRQDLPPMPAVVETSFDWDDETRSHAMMQIKESTESARVTIENAKKSAREALSQAKKELQAQVKQATSKKVPPPPPAPSVAAAPPAPTPPAPNRSSRRNSTPRPTQQPSVLSGVVIAPDATDEELAKVTVKTAETERYIVRYNQQLPNEQRSQVATERAMKLLDKHVLQFDLDPSSWNRPSIAWLEMNGILRDEPHVNQLVVLDVSPKSLRMVYNHHLGVQRTHDLAGGYAGGVLVLGGIALLLRIGTGLRPPTPARQA